jgi:hypothetical protein
MRRKWFVLGPLAVVGLLVFIAAGALAVKLLWNWLLPAIFGWRPISFWQALGLLALCRILFGGLGRRGVAGRGMRTRMAEGMTPEEKQRMRQRMLERCGFPPSAAETKPQQP